MLDCVKSALLPDLRAHNVAQIARAGLPDELWCMIWSHLSTEDRVRVTHVCSAWRQLAVGTPRLWCSLDFFSSRHDGDCDCGRCRFLHDEDAVCDRCDDDLLIGRSNLVLVTALLPRSQQLPLHLHVDTPHYETDEEALHELAVALVAHAHRLEVIYIYSQDEQTVLRLLNGLGPTLPALRVLDCNIAHFPSLVKAMPVTLPCLQTVALRDGYGYVDSEDYADVPSFPSVHTLHIRVTNQDDLESYLNTFPSVQHLHVTVAKAAMRTAPAIPLSGRTNARSISSLHVYDVSPSYEDVVLAFFHDVKLHTLVIVYDPDPSPAAISERPSPCSGLDIFVDLSRPTILRCSAKGAYDAVLSAEDNGKRREVRVPSSAVGFLWKSLSTTHLSTVRIDASLCSALFCSVAPEFPALRLFEIALKDPDDFIDVLGKDIFLRMPSISAPSLDTLRILNLDPTSFVRINASHIALLANLFCGGRVIRTLSLRRILVIGAAQELSSIASTVEYGVHGGFPG